MDAGRASKVVCFSDFQLDLRAGELSRNGIRIKVPLQSIQLLELLVGRAGEVVTREELQKKLWPNSTIVEFEHSINAAINRLRQALSDSAESPRLIETLPKRGYRFMVSVATLPEKAAPVQASGDGPGSISDGQVLADRFRIVRLAGRGGMGEVYEAHDTRLDRRVALKFLPDEFARDPKALERFDAEARAIAALNHPHICTVYDTGTHENWPFIVMEYIEGETLERRLANGWLPLDELLRYAIEIADALDQAHRQGVILRDIKPANLMLTASGAKLLDFGLAKVHRTQTAAGSGSGSGSGSHSAPGARVGTLQYMSPEQSHVVWIK
jgi:DNA-binding winged helix-turn-helix (wHTH) protein